MAPTSPACEVCGNRDGNSVHDAREMMFGFRDVFHYLECGACKCLQLLDVPADMARYYPANYYSFAPSNAVRDAVKHWRAQYSHGMASLAGWVAEQLLGPDHAMRAIRRSQIPFDARILDVGCGAGHLIRDMKRLGYASVSGLDPFLPADLHHPDGVTVRKCSIEDLDGSFDVVMSHHAFEHMAAPARALAAMRARLADGGRILIRIPVADSFAWRRYGANWINLDAPRHLFLHTPASMAQLATQAGLVVSAVVFEGNASQIIGSEQYAREIPLSDPRSVYAGGWRRWLGWWQARQLQSRVDELNRNGQADWACFELRAAHA